MSAPSCRVLVVDDDPVGRRFLAEALRVLPVDVDCAADCASARRIATGHAHPHALALLDLHLPDGDGWTLLAQLRERGCACTAIALTADPTTTLDAAMRSAGFVAVAHKPLAAAELRALVTRWLPGAHGDAQDEASAAQGSPDSSAATAFCALWPTPPDAGTAAAADDRPPTWDDETALAAVGGRSDIVAALRSLLRADLPTQREQVLAAVDTKDVAGARAVLHRMQAACGFCGAARLANAVVSLDAALAAGHEARAALEDFQRACAEIQAEAASAR